MKHTDSLSIKSLFVSVGKTEILKGVSLTVLHGQTHIIMGPNGSGKSTLAYALMGHPQYKCRIENTECRIQIGKKNIISLPADERAKAGLFLALQSPIAIPGVTVVNLLRTAYQQIHDSGKVEPTSNIQNPVLARRWKANGISLADFTTKLKMHAKALRIDESLLNRGIHDGFSGGEKKKFEMLQALVLAPKFAVFDEIDTGLDVDALKLVARAVQLLVQGGTGVLVITHYQRILKYLKPDVVHVLVAGRIVDTGTAKLAKKIESEGYVNYATASHH